MEHNIVNCKNCGSALQDNYCSHCGQPAKFARISATFFYHELIHFFTHVEKGFLFTSIKMILKPGETVRNFIEGRRRIYQAPVSYFLIWTSVYIVLIYAMESFFGENTVITYNAYFGPGGSTKFAISHLALVLAMIIPVQALFLYLLVTKGVYNYFETIVASIYILGTILLFQIVFLILAVCVYLSSGQTLDLKLSDVFKITYLSWSSYDFIRSFKLPVFWLRLLLFILLAFSTFTLWRMFGYPALMHFLNRH